MKSLFIALGVVVVFTFAPFQAAPVGNPNGLGVADVKSVAGPVVPASDRAAKAAPVSPQEPPFGVIAKNQRWDKIHLGSRTLRNNVWGAPYGETLDSGVYLDGKVFGWYWGRHEPRPLSRVELLKPIYPSVRLGASPWEKSNSEHFPVKLGDVKSLRLGVAYNYSGIPTGSYDLAYDLFLTDESRPSRAPRIKAEVMVWIHAVRQQPWTTYKGDFSDGTNTYALYSWVMADGRAYYSFILKEDPGYRAQHAVDVGSLMGYLALDPAWYVTGVELGNEVWDGSGMIEISQFNVEMNGSGL